MKKVFHYFPLPILLIISISSLFYFNFTAEDAYITYRYAENWVNTGSLVYNPGEPINAMTSPFHAILSAAFFLATRHTVLFNKIIGVLLLLLSALFVWLRYKNQPQWQALALALILLPPAVILWTFGGLETPVLLFLVTSTVLLAERKHTFSLLSLCAVFLLAGLTLLTRYDSVLFLFPVTLHAASKARSIKHILTALIIGSILPLAWFIISIFYYGDLLPTSFYVKTPNGDYLELFYNAVYIVSNLINVGIIPVLVLAFVLNRLRRSTFQLLYFHFKKMWWLYLGLLFELLYGLTMATHHMMFSFRFFIPYLPSTVIVVVDLLRLEFASQEADLSSGRPAKLFTGFLVGLMLFQLYQNLYTYTHSVNGISPIGEYRSLGVRDYNRFMEILHQEALDIEAHWEKVKDSSDRRPRIITYAAGILPYTFRDSYIYEQLVSYRHCHQRHNQGLFADYLHILAPRHGLVNEQLPKPEGSYTLVSSYESFFDGSMQEFLVYYNPGPLDHNLTQRVYEPCNRSGLLGKSQ